MPTNIRKVVYAAEGGPEVVSVIIAPIADPAQDEVQIKVIYSHMGGGDIAMRLGYYPQQPPAAGLTPGYALIGRVHKNGPGSSKFKPGNLVACLTKTGSEAELCNCGEKYLIPVPDGLDLTQAVPLITDWTTAYGMAYRTAKVSKGTRVFIHGLSGSVGFALLTLLKLQGADVYGTASEKNHAAVREAGATPFTYTNKAWMTSMKSIGGAHYVFDPLGFESWDESWDILANDGHLVGYGGNFDMLNGNKPRSQYPQIAKLLARGLVPFCPKKTTFFYIDKDQKTFEPELKTLFDMLKHGDIKPRVRKLCNLDEVPEAHKTWSKSTGVGAIVIKVAADARP